jgi:CBS domain-containing protein
MESVGKLIEAKGADVWSLASGASVYEAIAMMAHKGCGALLVMDGDTLAGIVSERDYARKVILAGRSSRDTRVSEIMSAPVITAAPSSSVEDCLEVMTRRRIRHLPVVDGGRVVGVVSIGDLVKSIVAEQRYLIAQLEQYIKQ